MTFALAIGVLVVGTQSDRLSPTLINELLAEMPHASRCPATRDRTLLGFWIDSFVDSTFSTTKGPIWMWPETLHEARRVLVPLDSVAVPRAGTYLTVPPAGAPLRERLGAALAVMARTNDARLPKEKRAQMRAEVDAALGEMIPQLERDPALRPTLWPIAVLARPLNLGDRSEATMRRVADQIEPVAPAQAMRALVHAARALTRGRQRDAERILREVARRFPGQRGLRSYPD